MAVQMCMMKKGGVVGLGFQTDDLVERVIAEFVKIVAPRLVFLIVY